MLNEFCHELNNVSGGTDEESRTITKVSSFHLKSMTGQT